MNPFEWMGKQLGAADQAIVDQARKRVADRNSAAAARMVALGPESMVNRVFDGRTMKGPNRDMQAKRDNLQRILTNNPLVMDAMAQRVASTNPGLLRQIDQGIADNEWVRRGLLPTAVVGGGAMLTEAGVQLAQLTGLLQDSVAQQQRTDSSELMA